MTYIIYSEKEELRNDFSLKLARELSKDRKITLIDLDSANRDLAIELEVAEFTIYDIEDVLMGIVDFEQAEIEVEENLYLISASIREKYEFDKEIEVDNSVVIVKDKDKLKYFDYPIFSITDSLGEFPGSVIAYDMDKKELKELSKNNKLVSVNQSDNFIKDALEGEKIEFKGLLERILSIFKK